LIRLKDITESILHLFFPHVCAGCGSDLPNKESHLCLRCLHDLPFTNFEKYINNPVEKIFRGRLPLIAGCASLYFNKDSIVQQLMHELKYKGNKELGWQLGNIMGKALKETGRISPDVLIPLPLFPRKQKQRGYNQSMLLCQGMAEVLNLPIIDKAVIRPHHTETQTRKGRIERWQNMEGKFLLRDPLLIKNKHLLLIDDVITTGATIESCGEEILKVEGTSLSIASLCIAIK
jgi:ComF family protein